MDTETGLAWRISAWTYKRGIITHNLDEKEQLLSPQKNYNLLTKNNKDAKVNLKVAKEIAKKYETSFLK